VSDAQVVAFDSVTGALIAALDPSVSTTVAAIAATAATVCVGGTLPVTAIHSRPMSSWPGGRGWPPPVPVAATSRSVASHPGLIHNPEVLRVIGKALAQQHRR
jgi:hypothetical protein